MKTSILSIAAGFLTAAIAPAQNPPEPASAAYFSNGKLLIVSSSHQDTGWMDTPAACRQGSGPECSTT